MDKALSVYRKAGSVSVSGSLRDRLKTELNELNEQYTEQWDERNKLYVFTREETE